MELKEKIDLLKGKNHEEIEKLLGFNYYLETKDRFLFGKKVEHSKLIEAFIKFNKNNSFVVVKFLDGIIQETMIMDITPIKENLFLLEENKGLFSNDMDEELATSYGFLCENYITEVMQGIIFFSGKEEYVKKFSIALQQQEIEHFEPKLIGKKDYTEAPLRKLGRNEPCHCGSGIKYKKCCINKDIKETGKVKKVKDTYDIEDDIEMEDENEKNNLWEEGDFAETLGNKDIKERMKTFHKRHDEDMDFNCKKCNKKISAHNKDWHNGMCDNCFNNEYF